MAKITDKAKKRQLTVYLPDTRGVTISPFGIGNLKIGLGVHTYSRLPGFPRFPALGLVGEANPNGTCPGATIECLEICYARRPVVENGPVYAMWRKNSETEDVPAELPPDCKVIRLHISGDFTSVHYIESWIDRLTKNPNVKMWAYTRSWRVPELLKALEQLRALPNVQLFASVDSSTPDAEFELIKGWRRSWIDGDPRQNTSPVSFLKNRTTFDGARSLVCPEETGDKTNCEECRYCFDGKRNDVTFLKH